jgi:hypothetical protein
MRYTPLATDALCPMPTETYALCPREHLMLLRKAIDRIIRLMKILLVAPEKRELAKNLKIPTQ